MHRVSVFRARVSWLLACVTACAAIAATPARAQDRTLPAPANLDLVPDALAPWIPWVLRDAESQLCPLLDAGRHCVWPGRARFALGSSGGVFRLDVWAGVALDLELPGDARAWPIDVQIDGAPALMAATVGVPRVRIPAGSHVVEGRFAWTRLPEALAVPPSIALIDVRLHGAPLGRVRRETSGAVWLNAAPTDQNEADSLNVDVWRRFSDGVPLQVETRVHLRVGGDPREIDLGAPVMAGFAVWALESPLPARIDEGGRLRVQLRAGDWTVTLRAVATAPSDRIEAALGPAPWPDAETWVFVANDRARSVRLGGAAPIDPARTSLPPDWVGAPTFRLTDGEVLELTELRRGEPTPAPASLSVMRRIWLDRDGLGLIVRDHVSGEIFEGGRLDVQAPATADRIGVDGDGQVITTHESATGVEVRRGAVDVSADLSYTDRRVALPASGWTRDVQSLSVELQLPPGWRLLAASGPDTAQGAWIERWTLYDLFVLLLTVVVAFKVMGVGPAAALLVVVGLSWHEEESVRSVWVTLLAVAAIAGALPPGRLRTLASMTRAIIALALMLGVVRFAWTELRTGLFPELEGWDVSSGVYDDVSLPLARSAPVGLGGMATVALDAAPPMEQAMEFEVKAEEAARSALLGEEGRVAGGGWDTRNMPSGSFGDLVYATRTAQIDPNAVVQTGRGVPQWTWRGYNLSWSGPVGVDETMRLYLLPPWLDLVLSLVRALGALALGVLFARHRAARTPATPNGGGAARTAAAASVALVALAGTAPAAAQGLPDPALLAELRNVVLEPAPCGQACVEFARADLTADAAGIALEAEIHVAADGAWRLPGPDGVWLPAEVSVDGVATSAIFRDTAGFLAVRLAPGIHVVAARGPAAPSVALQFSTPPRVMSWSVDGWVLDGYQPDQAPPSSVQLRRLRDEGAAPVAEEGGPTGVAPRFAVSRTLDIGVPMATHTTITRLGFANESAVVRVPLLPGETVTTPGFRVETGAVVVTFPPGAPVLEWDANLAETDAIALTAPLAVPWTETWSLLCSPVWHCRATGLVATAHMEGGRWAPTWHPWPGEAVEIALTRPAPVDGASITIDTADLEVDAGRRMQTSTLALTIRASRGGEQAVHIGAGAEVRSFTVDGATRPFELVDGRVAYTLEPGLHTVVLSWQAGIDAGLSSAPPAVDVGLPIANARVALRVPDNRWVIWAGRATWGPVVRFWEFAIVLLVVAVLIGRALPAPVHPGGWFLLGLGVTQVNVAAAIAVLGWFAVLAFRPRWRSAAPWWIHNLVQLGTAALTFAVVGVLLQAVAQGLALRPPSMHVQGLESSDTYLVWRDYALGTALPTPRTWWLPMWVWRATMLAWSAWLAFGVVRWAKWGWSAFHDEGMWSRRRAAERGLQAPLTLAPTDATPQPAPGAQPRAAATGGDDAAPGEGAHDGVRSAEGDPSDTKQTGDDPAR